MKHVFWLDPGRIGGRPGPTLEEWSPQELLSSGLREHLAPDEAVARIRLVRPEAITADGWEGMANRVLARLLDKADT